MIPEWMLITMIVVTCSAGLAMAIGLILDIRADLWAISQMSFVEAMEKHQLIDLYGDLWQRLSFGLAMEMTDWSKHDIWKK